MKIEELSREASEYIDKLQRGLQAAGKNLDVLSPIDLAPADQFHVRGLAAIQDIIAGAGISATDHVFDLGCGLGGPARILAKTIGCTVTGFDLHGPSVEIGNLLSTWTGLADTVTLVAADATAIPGEDGQYDVGWTIHVGMFIKDKQAFYGEAARLLKPGGTFIIFDPIPTGEVGYHYPVPWARSEEDDYSLSQSALEKELTDAGFDITWSESRGHVSLEWFHAQAKAAAQSDGPSPLGLHLLIGSAFREMSKNAYRNLKEGQMDIVEIHAVKR